MKSVRPRLALVLSALLGALSVKAAGEGEAVSAPPALDLKPLALVTQLLYEGDLAEPRGVAVDRVRGEVWVADARAGVVALFTPEGVPVFASRGDGHLKEPSRVTPGPDGRLYVLDNDRSKVKILSYRGEFQSIAGIAVDSERIYVVDHQVLAVQVFDRRGNFLKGWGKHDLGVANFSLPEDVALDSAGRIVVVDALRHEIKFFDQNGVLLNRFGGLGSRAGEISFPAGVAIGADDRLYVVEKGNGRLQVLAETNTPPPVRATP